MSSVVQASPEEATGLDLAQAFRLLWRYKVLVCLTTLAAGMIALWMALTAIPYFRAEVVLAEVRERGLGNVNSLASQLGGLASLAGVALSPGVAGTNQEAAAILDSNALAAEFIRRNNLMPQLLKGSAKPMTLWRAVRAFKEGVLTIRKDQRKGVTTVTMEWPDPAVAANWANAFVALANEIVRARALTESTRNIDYLNEQLARTNVVELRKVMFDIIENETKQLMLAKGRIEYAFEVVDPAVAPEIKVRPKRSVIVLVGLVLGFLVGAGAAFILSRITEKRTAAQSGRSHSSEHAAP